MQTSRWTMVILVGLAWAATESRAGNLIRVYQGEFHKPGLFPMWASDLGYWETLPLTPLYLQERLQPLAAHGVNTIMLRLASPDGKSDFFASSGSLADEDYNRRFGILARNIRDHYMACVISVFSANRRHWLDSREAYERAGENLAGTLLDRYSTIFYLGDLTRDTSWPGGAPCNLDDPEVLAGIARKIVAVKEDAVVAVPARLVDGHNRENAFYASTDPEALLKWMTTSSARETLTTKSTNTVVFPHARIHLCDDPVPVAPLPCPKPTQVFLDRVERDRFALEVPDMPVSKGGDACLSPAEREEDFELLFNGSDLSGWTTLAPNWGGWTVEDGTIHCKGINGPWLMTRKRYESFILRLEFKIEKEGNSGVFLRASLDGRCSRFGMEMQIRGKQFDPTDRDATGAIYDVRAPIVDAALPAGRWNAAEITCRGDHVTIRVNDRIVQDFDMKDEPKLKNRLRRGVIGLQDHDDKVWFRHLRIRELPADSRIEPRQ